MRFWSQNLNEDRFGRIKGSKLWHGRATLHFDNRMAEYTHWLESFRWEWQLGQRRFCFIGLDVNDYNDEELTFKLAVPFLFSLWFHVCFRRPKWWPRSSREFELGIRLEDFAVAWNLGCDPMGGYPCRPWFSSFNVVDFLVGHTKHAEQTIEERDVLVPMPEGTYPAKAKLFESTWKRARWPKAKRLIRVSIDMERGIPFPGKGESEWDCGQDATYGITCPANSIEEGVGELIASILQRRRRYGGPSWTPQVA